MQLSKTYTVRTFVLNLLSPAGSFRAIDVEKAGYEIFFTACHVGRAELRDTME